MFMYIHVVMEPVHVLENESESESIWAQTGAKTCLNTCTCTDHASSQMCTSLKFASLVPFHKDTTLAELVCEGQKNTPICM